MENVSEFLKVAEELARKAGEVCLELQNNLGDVKYKSAKDVVTIADVTSEKLIVEASVPHSPPILSVPRKRVLLKVPIRVTAGLSTR